MQGSGPGERVDPVAETARKIDLALDRLPEREGRDRAAQPLQTHDARLRPDCEVLEAALRARDRHERARPSRTGPYAPACRDRARWSGSRSEAGRIAPPWSAAAFRGTATGGSRGRRGCVPLVRARPGAPGLAAPDLGDLGPEAHREPPLTEPAVPSGSGRAKAKLERVWRRDCGDGGGGEGVAFGTGTPGVLPVVSGSRGKSPRRRPFRRWCSPARPVAPRRPDGRKAR